MAACAAAATTSLGLGGELKDALWFLPFSIARSRGSRSPTFTRSYHLISVVLNGTGLAGCLDLAAGLERDTISSRVGDWRLYCSGPSWFWFCWSLADAPVPGIARDCSSSKMEGDANWEELRKEARKIEGDLDVKLSSYAKLGGMLAHGGYVDSGSSEGLGGDGSWKSVELEIEALLEKLLDINDAMSRCVAAATTTTSITQKLARHRDILHEFTQEFRRTRGNITSMREHAELLTSVRNDISEYKATGSLSPGPSLLRERGAIHGSINQIEDVISQAQATKGALTAQRTAFVEIQSKVKQLSDRFPVVRGLLGAIKRKRSKDTLILSAVIAVCTLILLVYWMSK